MTGGSEQRFTLTAPPPVRALAIAAVTALVAAALMVASRVLNLGAAVLVVGIVGLVLAVALAVAAVVLSARARSTWALGADAVTIVRAGAPHRLPWAEIETITLTGPRLQLVRKPGTGADLAVLNPRTPQDPTFLALLAALQRRLDADRGYSTG